jgi:hypothetical protein
MTTPAFRPAPGVTVARLPFGGAVLFNGTTLDIVECDGWHRDLIDDLLNGAGGRPEARALAAQLVRGGWLTARVEGRDLPCSR